VGAGVTTQPIATDSINPGPGSFGITDEQGRYQLELVNPHLKGAIVGEHRVMIARMAGGEAAETTHKRADGDFEYWVDSSSTRQAIDRSWPQRFTDGSLRLEVPPEGRTDANFDLKR
jgi:hypothetical protein